MARLSVRPIRASRMASTSLVIASSAAPTARRTSDTPVTKRLASVLAGANGIRTGRRVRVPVAEARCRRYSGLVQRNAEPIEQAFGTAKREHIRHGAARRDGREDRRDRRVRGFSGNQGQWTPHVLVAGFGPVLDWGNGQLQLLGPDGSLVGPPVTLDLASSSDPNQEVENDLWSVADDAHVIAIVFQFFGGPSGLLPRGPCRSTRGSGGFSRRPGTFPYTRESRRGSRAKLPPPAVERSLLRAPSMKSFSRGARLRLVVTLLALLVGCDTTSVSFTRVGATFPARAPSCHLRFATLTPQQAFAAGEHEIASGCAAGYYELAQTKDAVGPRACALGADMVIVEGTCSSTTEFDQVAGDGSTDGLRLMLLRVDAE